MIPPCSSWVTSSRVCCVLWAGEEDRRGSAQAPAFPQFPSGRRDTQMIHGGPRRALRMLWAELGQGGQEGARSQRLFLSPVQELEPPHSHPDPSLRCALATPETLPFPRKAQCFTAPHTLPPLRHHTHFDPQLRGPLLQGTLCEPSAGQVPSSGSPYLSPAHTQLSLSRDQSISPAGLGAPRLGSMHIPYTAQLRARHREGTETGSGTDRHIWAQSKALKGDWAF